MSMHQIGEEILMESEFLNSDEASELRNDCNEILIERLHLLTQEIETIQDQLNELKGQQQELLLAKNKIDLQYDMNSTLFSPYEKEMRKREEEKLNALLCQVKENQLIYSQKIVAQQEEYRKVCLLKRQLVSLETNALNLLKLQELERKKIADHLNETVLDGLKLLFKEKRLYSKERKRNTYIERKKLNETYTCMDKILNELSVIIMELYPTTIQDIGMIKSIDDYIKSMRHQYLVSIQFTTKGTVMNTSHIVQLGIFRMIQQFCNIITKEFKLSECNICLEYGQEEVCLVIENSEVEPIEQIETSKSDAYLIIREWIFLLSGKYRTDLNQSKKAKLIIVIPLKNEM